MKKTLLIVSLALLSFVNVKASNHAFDLTANSANYLKSTSAPLSGNAEFTIEMWFNNAGNSYNAYARLLGFSYYACDLSLVGTAGGTLMFYNGSSWKTTSATGLNTGWHHIAITNNLTEVIIYVDGVEQYRAQSPTFNFSGRFFHIGNSYALTSYDGLKAYYDEVRIWNRAKDLPEILNSMDKQLVGTESDLIAYYPMLKESFNDASSTGNNLTYSSSVGTKVFDFGDYINDYSLDFDGTDDRSTVTTPLSGDSDFTLEAQFKSTNTTSGAYRRIFAWTSYGFEIALVNGTIHTYKTSWQTTSTSNLNDGNWHHVAVTKSGSAIIVYVDGIQVAQRTASVNLTGTMTIGGLYSPSNGDMFIGQIDEVRVWDKARSITDIQTYMDATLVGNETNLVAYYDMNTIDTSVKNIVDEGSSLTRSGTSGTYYLPQFTNILSKAITPIIISTIDGLGCGTGTVDLSAISNSGTINWYDAQTAGNLLGSGSTFTTPSLSTTTIYYIDVEKNGLTSSTRVPVTATVNSIPQILTTVPSESCGSSSVLLSATTSEGDINWYNVSTGGTSLNTGLSYTTSSISTTTSYYVDATNNGCTSSRTEVIATINPIPVINTTIDASNCGAGSLVLEAGSDIGTINWYDSDSEGTNLGSGTSYTTPSLTETTSFYVSASDGDCYSSFVEVIATINEIPSSTVNQSNEELTVEETNGATYQWIDCNNENPIISNEESSVFMATETGSYAVIVTLGQCESTSNCLTVDFASINELETTRFDVYPNPASEKVAVSFDASNSDYTISLIDVTGRTLTTSTYTSLNGQQKIELPLEGINAGNYMISITSENRAVNKHIVVE